MVRKSLGEPHRKQIIFEAETLAAVVAFMLWASRCENKRCILFVDNEATKFSLLRGSSDNSVVDFLAEQFVEMEALVHTFTWLARVPSSCNIADAPSRGDVSSCLLHGADGSAGVEVAEIGEDWLRRNPSFEKDESVSCDLNMVCRRSFLSRVTSSSECKCSAPVLQMFSQVEG